MSELIFEEEPNTEFHIRSRRILGAPETPAMVQFLLKRGWAKNEKQALYILIAAIVIFLGISFYIFHANNTSSDTITIPDGRQISIPEYVQGVRQGIYQ